MAWQKENIDYKAVYGAALDEIDTDIEYGNYSLYDLDNNGIYELILEHGASSAEFVNDIWTVGYDGNMVKIGSIEGMQAFYVAPDYDGLYAVYGKMGYETITRITMENGEIIEEELVSEREIGVDEYYYSNDMEIYFVDIKDKSFLESY